MKTLVVICGLIGLFGIVGTPDYVADVERENETLRARVASLEGARYSCREMAFQSRPEPGVVQGEMVAEVSQ